MPLQHEEKFVDFMESGIFRYKLTYFLKEEKVYKNNDDEILIKHEPLVLPELSMLYKKKKKEARTVQQQ